MNILPQKHKEKLRIILSIVITLMILSPLVFICLKVYYKTVAYRKQIDTLNKQLKEQKQKNEEQTNLIVLHTQENQQLKIKIESQKNQIQVMKNEPLRTENVKLKSKIEELEISRKNLNDRLHRVCSRKRIILTGGVPECR